MTTKNLGPLVSGYLNPDGRNWETVGFQAGKPILDKELNLSQDLDIGSAQMAVKLALPSGWLTTGFMETSDTTPEIYTYVALSNGLKIPDQKVVVNGWPILVQHTNSDTGAGQIENLLDLGASPAGAGVTRTDLVILEVWRKLVAASPATDGKSPMSRIWLNGNVKLGSTDDATLNLADDILDTALGSESTKRVQIQYRLRVIQGIDLFSYPYGLDDPVVTARSTPTNPLTPDGAATTWPYVNQSANGDPGLWIAGDGIPTNTLATVDGYMYAIPLLAVFRRNDTAFDKNLNHNGGVALPGPSDRPDGYLYDLIEPSDVADLRMAVSPTGWDYAELGEKFFTYLLDNNLKTDWMLTTIGAGSVGHTVLWADEIGILPGDGVITGDTPGAEFIGQFDCTRRYFTDRPYEEILTFQVTPGVSPEVSTPTWGVGTTITISPTAIAQYPFPAAFIGNFMARAPTGTKILDIVRVFIRSNVPVAPQTGCEVGTMTQPTLLSDPWPIASVTGLGSYPVTPIVITLAGPPPTPTPPAFPITTEPMYIELLVAYPPGSGLTKTPTDDWGTASISCNNILAMPAIPPVDYNGGPFLYEFNYAHRELSLEYETTLQTFVMAWDCNTWGPFVPVVRLPERASSIAAARKNGVPFGAALLRDNARDVECMGVLMIPGDVIEFDYYARRAIPQSGVQFTIYYEARAPQTTRESLLGTVQDLVPRWISSNVYTLTCGSGTAGNYAPSAGWADEAYPFPYAYVQLGGLSATYTADHYLSGSPSVFISGFSSYSGYLKLPAYVPYTPNPQEVEFQRSVGDVDAEGRSFFAGVPTAVYQPNAFATPFTTLKSHRNMLPTVMELTTDSILGPKGMLVGIMLLRNDYYGGIENNVEWSMDTTFSLFRIPGYPLNRKV